MPTFVSFPTISSLIAKH